MLKTTHLICLLLPLLGSVVAAGCDKSSNRSVSRPAASPPFMFSDCEIYPTSGTLPENVLKFYVEFQEPMSRGEAYERVKIIDVHGEAVPYPFLELNEELWNSDQTRLTLFIDPARIKRELRPNLEDGPVFQEGLSYELTIDGEWATANGKKLGTEVRKRFVITSPDRQQPDPRRWKIFTPGLEEEVYRQVIIAGKLQLVEPSMIAVEFDEPLDYALNQRVFQLHDRAGKLIEGKFVYDDDQNVLWFGRADFQPFGAGKYKLVIDTALEDLAGNSIAKPFEVALLEKVDDAPPVPKFVELEFEVK